VSEEVRRARRAERAALQILRHSLGQRTPRARLREFKRRVAELPEDIRGATETLLVYQETLIGMVNAPESVARRDRIGLAVTGAVFMLILLAVALFVPSPTAFQERVFVIVLAVAAAAAGAFLPGTISVEGYHPSAKVRAAGAIAFAVFILLFYRFLI
jgi:hypothetical protein